MDVFVDVCTPGAPGSWCSSRLGPAAAVGSDCAAWSPPSPGHPTAACTAAAPPAGSPSKTRCPHSADSAGLSAHTHTHRHKDKLSTTWTAVKKKNVHINRYFKAVFSSLFLSLKWFSWSCSEGRRGHRCFFFTNRIFLTAQMCQCSTPVYISFLETNHPSWCLCNHHLLKSDRLSRMQTNRLQLHFFPLLRAADDTRLI